MSEVRVESRDYASAAAKLKAAPPKLRRAFRKRLRDAARPIGDRVLIAGAKTMPKSGGLAMYLMTSGKAAATLTGSGVTLRLSRAGVDLGKINDGTLRHPVWGHAPWVSQGVPAGTYDEAFTDEGQDAADQVGRVLDDIEREL